MTEPFVLGVTGSIACGKSTVTEMLAAQGAATIDADAVYHDLIRPGRPLFRALGERFGDGVVAPGGTIDRRALGAIVFADPVALADLDRLTHPPVVEELRRRIAAAAAPVVAVDAVKLVEGGFGEECDAIWVVVCGRATQVERLMTRNGLDREEAERRVAAQSPLGPKLAAADAVIDNGGQRAETEAQVAAAWAALPLADAASSIASAGGRRRAADVPEDEDSGRAEGPADA